MPRDYSAHLCQACRSEVGGSFIGVLIAGDKVR
jgi:hypothetical protein